jgi:hypothetical protein
MDERLILDEDVLARVHARVRAIRFSGPEMTSACMAKGSHRSRNESKRDLFKFRGAYLRKKRPLRDGGVDEDGSRTLVMEGACVRQDALDDGPAA